MFIRSGEAVKKFIANRHSGQSSAGCKEFADNYSIGQRGFSMVMKVGTAVRCSVTRHLKKVLRYKRKARQWT